MRRSGQQNIDGVTDPRASGSTAPPHLRGPSAVRLGSWHRDELRLLPTPARGPLIHLDETSTVAGTWPEAYHPIACAFGRKGIGETATSHRDLFIRPLPRRVSISAEWRGQVRERQERWGGSRIFGLMVPGRLSCCHCSPGDQSCSDVAASFVFARLGQGCTYTAVATDFLVTVQSMSSPCASPPSGQALLLMTDRSATPTQTSFCRRRVSASILTAPRGNARKLTSQSLCLTSSLPMLATTPSQLTARGFPPKRLADGRIHSVCGDTTKRSMSRERRARVISELQWQYCYLNLLISKQLRWSVYSALYAGQLPGWRVLYPDMGPSWPLTTPGYTYTWHRMRVPRLCSRGLLPSPVQPS